LTSLGIKQLMKKRNKPSKIILNITDFGLTLLTMASPSFMKTFKGRNMNKTTLIDYVLGTLFMIMFGGGLALIWIVAKGWF